MKKIVVAGNWKMNQTKKETEEFFRNLKGEVADKKVEIVLAVPFVYLETALRETENTNIKIAAQNLNYNDKGAFTGEISPLMLKDLKVSYVLVGHSERRQYYHECDKCVNLKIKAALKHGIKPIMCIGETLEEREGNVTEKVLKEQIIEGLKDIEDIENIIIAYEPVWAIGTGKTATSMQAEETHKYIRELLVELYGSKAKDVIIQYGGSMKPENAYELMSQENINGGLIGGASLQVSDFIKLVEAGEKCLKED